MPSKTDFNVSPYYDDFSEDKKFHRVMYRPAFAVQARELTTQQTILQNQIEKLGDSMYKHGSMVIPGEVTFDLNHFSIKLTSFTGTLSNFTGTTLTGGTSGVTAVVQSVVATDGTDPDTLFVKYKNSGTDNVSATFTDGETITSSASTGETAVVASSHTGSAAFIDAGTYYINGFFVEVDSQSLILDKYTNTPNYRVGLTVTEEFITSTDDTTLLDNATGSSNANATGAHRFKITLTLAKLSLSSTADSSFIETFRLKNGKLQNKPIDDVRTSIEDTLARRTYDESGDYVVDDFELDIREHLLSGTNRGIYAAGSTSDDGNTADEAKLAFGLSQGKAYVKGYEIGKIGTTYVDVNKARDFETDSGSTTRFDIGSFVNVENVHGTPDINFVSGEIENYKTLRLVDTPHSTRGTVFGTSLAYVYDIGRAKTRAFEYNAGNAVSPDSGTTTHLSNAATTDVKFKHFLFDIEMFSHVNVQGAMSGALTTGDKLTGGTSGATGIIESISTAESATITGATQADPVVVTCSGGHNFTEGQAITIASVAGMTDINTNHTVKNPTATTFELFGLGTATDSTPEPLDGTGFSPYTSGGTASHTVVVLNDVQGEFSAGETITAPTNSRTGTVQFTAFGCKGFEQKEFGQTKGISMAGSPTYTANVSLDSTHGDVLELIGTISTVSPTESQGSVIMDGTDANGANSGDSIILEDATDPSDIVFAIGLEAPADLSDRLVGSGTKFLTDFKIGDSIEFVDDGGSVNTRIIESIHSNTILETSIGLGTATATSKTYNRRRAKLQNAEKNTAIFPLPYDVVKTLLTTDNSGLSDTSFKIRRQFVTTLSSSGTATLTAGTNEVFSAFTENDYTVSIMTVGSGSTGAVGDIISLSTSGDFTLGGSPTGKTLAIDLGSGYNGHKIKVIATISASVVGAKTKTDTTGTTVTIDTEALATDDFISLGKADVHKLNSVFMAADFSTAADTDDTDVTDRFELDTGQRDTYYDIARLTLKPGKVNPTGRLLINFDYFEHGAGNFFTVDSYSGFDYASIPAYTSDVTGEQFSLRDCLDFRPRVDNASTINSGGVDRSFDGTGASAIEFAKINSDVTSDLEYYLANRARVYLTSKGEFKVVKGASAIEPAFGEQLKDAIHLYDVFMPAYTFDTSTIEIKAIDNRRYTMRDIGGLHKRIESMEYYTQLSLLEQDAKSMQIQDADGFDRFKNGFFVDNFVNLNFADTSSPALKASIDINKGHLRPGFQQRTVPISKTLVDTASMDTANVTKTGDMITLAYTSRELQKQPYASKRRNCVQELLFNWEGEVVLDPPMDNDNDLTTLPELQVDFDGFFNGVLESLRIQGASPVRTTFGGWETTTSVNANRTLRTTTNNRTVTTSTLGSVTETISLGNSVESVSLREFMRSRVIRFTGVRMRPNTRVFAYFDKEKVFDYVTPTNSSFVATGVEGANLVTDSTGTVYGNFRIPNDDDLKFRVGTKRFLLQDIDDPITKINLITTAAHGDFTSQALDVTQRDRSINLRVPQVTTTQTTQTTTSVTPIPRPRPAIRRVAFQGCCFIAGTLVTMSDGSTKKIEDVEVGDVLLGKDNHHNTVLNFVRPKLGQRQLMGINGSGAFVTADHPLWTQDGWKAHDLETTKELYPHMDMAGTLAIGDKILNTAGEWTEIETIEVFADDEELQVYNFTLDGNKTYFGNDILAHNKGGDPLAQSFFVTLDDLTSGAYVNKIDLFFAKKDSSLPITLQIRKMENGFPTTEVIASKTLAASAVNTSSTGATATSFTFDNLVFLSNQEEYAFVAIPGGNSDQYQVWVAQMGGDDVLLPNTKISKQTATGILFSSANDSTWRQFQDEDMKYTIHCAKFTKKIGRAHV